MNKYRTQLQGSQVPGTGGEGYEVSWEDGPEVETVADAAEKRFHMTVPR